MEDGDLRMAIAEGRKVDFYTFSYYMSNCTVTHRMTMMRAATSPLVARILS